MLDRVEKATILQRQFVADASHELRSPLTRIRTDLEVSIAHPDTSDPVATYRRLLADAIDLEILFEDLLLLARTDAGADGADRAVVDLDDLVLAEATRLRQRGEVRVDTNQVSAARVRGDRNQLVRVVRNLADNAERHAHSLVTFELREHDHISELAVSDDGFGIPAAYQTAVFERFARLDDARAHTPAVAGWASPDRPRHRRTPRRDGRRDVCDRRRRSLPRDHAENGLTLCSARPEPRS